jgi:hypothetical protein
VGGICKRSSQGQVGSNPTGFIGDQARRDDRWFLTMVRMELVEPEFAVVDEGGA